MEQGDWWMQASEAPDLAYLGWFSHERHSSPIPTIPNTETMLVVLPHFLPSSPQLRHHSIPHFLIEADGPERI